MCTRLPSGSRASVNGWETSIRRPVVFSIRSTRSETSSSVSTVVVSSCRPSRAMNTRDGSLIQISSTAGSSRYRWSGPKPATRSCTSRLTASRSPIGGTIPVRLRSSYSLHDGRDDGAHRGRVAQRVDALAPDDVAHLGVDQLDRAVPAGPARGNSVGCHPSPRGVSSGNLLDHPAQSFFQARAHRRQPASGHLWITLTRAQVHRTYPAPHAASQHFARSCNSPNCSPYCGAPAEAGGQARRVRRPRPPGARSTGGVTPSLAQGVVESETTTERLR